MDRTPRRLLIGLLATAIVGSLGAGAGIANAAPPGTSLVRSFRTLSVNGGTNTTLCVDETEKFGVGVMVAEEYRDSRGQTTTLGRFTGQPETVKAASSDATIVSVSPATWRQGSAFRGSSRANFTIKANRRGTATITFSDGRGIAPAVPVKVEVKDCHYEISMTGKWFIAVGFEPTVLQTVTAMRLDYDAATRAHTADPSALNQATAPDEGDCSVTYGVPRSTVRIKVIEDPRRRGRLQLSIDYFPITNVIPQVCHRPLAFYTGTGRGQIRPLKLSITLTGSSGTATVAGHILDADGEWPGTTTITITKVAT